MADDLFDILEQEQVDGGGGYEFIAIRTSVEDNGDFAINFSVREDAVRRAKFHDPNFEVPPVLPTLATYSAQERRLVLYPTITSPDNSRFLKPRYAVRSITLEDQDSVVFRDNAGAVLEDLPMGFIHDARQGFGLLPKNRLIMLAVAKIRGVSDLILTDDNEKTGLLGSSLRMTFWEYDHVRRAIQRSHVAAIKIVNAEKEVYLYNQIVSPIDPVRYPPKPLPYQKDALQRAIARGITAPGTISRSDQRAAVEIVRTEIRTIAARDETELLELGREIEVVSLEMVIEKMTGMMEKKLEEADWQKFLSLNPFVLRLAFGLPIMVFGEQVAVGGVRFDNRGGKLADFVVKTGGHGNLAIIEIKKPDTVLIEPKHYRLGLHAPSKDLAGGVNQVIDQRYMLSREIDTRKSNSLQHHVWTYGVKCYVIAGRTITEEDALLQEAKRKSFEFYRHGLSDVTVITFDELLEKLKALLSFLKPAEG